MARGRKRRFNPNIPGHIEQEALPKGIYWENGRWYMHEDHPDGGRQVKRTVAFRSARLSELHAIAESRLRGDVRGTLRYLFDRFHEASEFKELQHDTQKDYRRYADTLANYVRKDGSKLGGVQLEHITTPVVQRLLETFANGRPATRLQQALPPTPSKANHLYRYLRRTLAWGGCAMATARRILQLVFSRRRRLRPSGCLRLMRSRLFYSSPASAAL
ncbi:hypothetical protein IXO97_017065 [Xanthomonas oryzae pv. oryzae]|nr:hypothetical protein IXO97_017065 [Xanthomonas oryzae pv. oryzae]